MAGDCGISCPVDGGYFSYSPSIAGNAILLALFSLLLPITLYMGYLFRTPFFSAVLATGLAFDVVGFAGRVLLHGDRASQTYFTLSMLGTVLGPTFTAAAIFVVLPHVLAVYGDHLSPCRPSFVEAGLCSLTCAALVIELVGVLFVVYSFRDVPRSESAGIVAGGLAVQSAALFGASVLYFWFTLKLNSGRRVPDESHVSVYLSNRFGRFLRGLETATALLLVYSVYRVIEMAGGVDGDLFQSEKAFMVMNGAIPLAVCILLSVFHPGIAYGSSWDQTSPRRAKQPIQLPLQQQPLTHRTHYAYEPNIRHQFPARSRRPNRALDPPQAGSGSAGLPATPRPSHKPPSPRAPSPKSTIATSRRHSGRSERKSHVQPDLVDSDMLW
ncbi:RTA-like protein [Purpureocillium lilacinum]|uniref:RTA-like protein n=1 Tax=Purpureocillium lilacinum TaxID=33203 RepID=A0A179GCC8_PURLI|nr:RTA-like protein [Purpureocillium lilacinum]OAQ75446.1 RTA-like protein [Purpureocillium lilacinum]OAQ81073.1 RTA-like protein [Purpureocillium lilacinum]